MFEYINIDEEQVLRNSSDQEQQQFCKELEKANILFFPSLSFINEKEYINLKEKISSPIHYFFDKQKIQGLKKYSFKLKYSFKELLLSYASSYNSFLSNVFPSYCKTWKLMQISLWPGKDNDHVIKTKTPIVTDSLPKYSLNGSRILRVFTNLHMKNDYEWIISDSFESIVEKFGRKKCLSYPNFSNHSLVYKLNRRMKKCINSIYPDKHYLPYDSFLISLRKFLRSNQSFQNEANKKHLLFSPLSTWAVFSDCFSFAHLSKKDLLELVFIVPKRELLNPEKSPSSLLERLSRNVVIEPQYECIGS